VRTSAELVVTVIYPGLYTPVAVPRAPKDPRLDALEERPPKAARRQPGRPRGGGIIARVAMPDLQPTRPPQRERAPSPENHPHLFVAFGNDESDAESINGGSDDEPPDRPEQGQHAGSSGDRVFAPVARRTCKHSNATAGTVRASDQGCRPIPASRWPIADSNCASAAVGGLMVLVYRLCRAVAPTMGIPAEDI
jgi:hypothetical protein